jgi:hypothetical protein
VNAAAAAQIIARLSCSSASQPRLDCQQVRRKTPSQ